MAKPRVRGSAEQVHVTGAKRGAQLVLRERRGRASGAGGRAGSAARSSAA